VIFASGSAIRLPPKILFSRLTALTSGRDARALSNRQRA
jgi:hypothetical protein